VGAEGTQAAPAKERRFPCGKCGASLVFKPGADALTCPYCGHENPIAQAEAHVEEHDFLATLDGLAAQQETQDAITVHCQGCGAESTLPPDTSADECPFCGTAIVSTQKSVKQIKPKSLLPFKVTREQARASFKKWLRSRWFAPNALKKIARVQGKLQGMYVPYWTYDCNTVTAYRGQRGEYYYVTRRMRVNGKMQTRRERKTRWYPASGVVQNVFDDVLVLASRSLPKEHAIALEPWDLQSLVPYQDDYLSGFRAETYQVGLKDGFQVAQGIMDGPIRETVCRDIGGDTQRISAMDVTYKNVSFKHVLLPVWLSAYRYREKVYRFLVNARTGEVQGARPWSWIKISLAVLAGALVVGVLVLVFGEGEFDFSGILNGL